MELHLSTQRYLYPLFNIMNLRHSSVLLDCGTTYVVYFHTRSNHYIYSNATRRRQRGGHAVTPKINLTLLSVVSVNVSPIFDNRLSNYQYVSLFIFCRNESRVHFNCPKIQIHEIFYCKIKPNYKTWLNF
jgi:hypothetical protein